MVQFIHIIQKGPSGTQCAEDIDGAHCIECTGDTHYTEGTSSIYYTKYKWYN